MRDINIKDIVEILEFILQNKAMSIDENLALSYSIKLLNEHDALVQEVKNYQEKEKICSSCAEHPHKMIMTERRAEKAEAEVERLKDILHLVETIKRDLCVWCGEPSHTEECKMNHCTSNFKISETALNHENNNVQYFKLRLNWVNEKRKDMCCKFNTGKERCKYITFTIKI